MSASSDRNLLFGLITLKMDFVTHEGLLDAMHAWLDRKADPLGLILQQRGALTPGRVTALEALVDEHLADHGGDARRGLAAVRAEAPTRAVLGRLADADMQDSVAALGPATVPDCPPYVP